MFVSLENIVSQDWFIKRLSQYYMQGHCIMIRYYKKTRQHIIDIICVSQKNFERTTLISAVCLLIFLFLLEEKSLNQKAAEREEKERTAQR